MAEKQPEENEPDWQCESCQAWYEGGVYRCKECDKVKPYLMHQRPQLVPFHDNDYDDDDDNGDDDKSVKCPPSSHQTRQDFLQQGVGGLLGKGLPTRPSTTERKHAHIDDIISDFPVPECRLVLLGKTGSGKSSTGNTIIGSPHFQVSEAFGSTISKCFWHTITRFGVTIEIVDTPGFCDTRLDEVTVTKEVAKCVGMVSPGPHALLIVIPIGRFTKETADTIDLIRSLFDDSIVHHMIIVFSCGDNLDNRDIEDLLGEGPPELLKLIEITDRRYVVFNNNEKNMSKRNRQVKELLLMVKALLSTTKNQHFTNHFLERCEEAAVLHTQHLGERLAGSPPTESSRQLIRAGLETKDVSVGLLDEVLENGSRQTAQIEALNRKVLELQKEKNTLKSQKEALGKEKNVAEEDLVTVVNKRADALLALDESELLRKHLEIEFEKLRSDLDKERNRRRCVIL